MRRLPPALAPAALALAAGLLVVPPAASAPSAPPVPERADQGALPADRAGQAVLGRTAARRAAGAGRAIAYDAWDGFKDWHTGTLGGLRVIKGDLRPGTGMVPRKLGGRAYQQGSWTSGWVTPGFGLTELIPSWSATTPGDSFLEVRVRGTDASGRVSSWDLMGRWASGDATVRRSTSSGQSDDLGTANVDTWQASGTAATTGLSRYQVRVTLARRAGTRLLPTLDTVGAVASRLPEGRVNASKPGPASAAATVLDVPRYSQMTHRGHYPQWGNGGQAWCSPTSTSMVLGYYRSLPGRAEYPWVPRDHAHPWVDFAARATYDHDYGGTGNWAFNTAYAAPRAGKAFVTRLRSLREAELLVAAGIPVVASISFASGQLSGAPISASNGHLLVIVGFTRTGDVVVNDPAGANSKGVRRTYSRAQFENAWLPTSGGTVYVIRDGKHPLPASPGGNW